MRTKRAGIGTKFVILTLLVVCITSLLGMNEKLRAAQEELDALNQQVIQQTQKNAALAEDIENQDDPEQVANIARDKLGLLEQDEMVFVDTSN